MKNKRERRPCVVYGASGCGKTSVLAKTATEVTLFHFHKILNNSNLFQGI